jgi:sigma-B regulation protein RsbU (phosphoserine phosphatase)
MVITKTLLQTEASKGLPLNEVLQNVNRMLCHNNAANMFATVSVGVINFNTGNIILANAGHVPPLHKRANGSFNYVNIPANIVLGVDDEFDFELFNYQLKPTETLFLYTDGVTEAMNKQEQEFSEERLLRVFAKIPHTESQRIVKKIRAEIQDFADGEDQSDDITMLALTYFGPKSLHSEES